jgi:hypothetical protein
MIVMPTNKLYTRLFFLLIICLTLSYCHLDTNSNEEFLIKVDSIHIPDIIKSEKPFNLVLYGTIGYNECYSLFTINQQYDGNDIYIETWGTFIYQEGKCPEGLVTINGHEYQMMISPPGNYRILMVEPDNSVLIKQITVVE